MPKYIQSYENFSQKIIILYFEDELLLESLWRELKGYYYRVDNSINPTTQKHIHISRKKDKNNKYAQVSWNIDGSRHDKKTFNDSFQGLEIAKVIAREVLNLDDDFLLEYVENYKVNNNILNEHIINDNNIFVFKY